MPASDVLFDASSYPNFEKAMRQNLLVWNMIFISSILIWPIMIAIFYLMIPDEEFESGVSKSTLILIFIIMLIVDIIAMVWLRKKFALRWNNPIRITSQGMQLSENTFLLATEIKKIRIDNEGSIGFYKEGKGFPIKIISKGQLGNVDEFIKILKQQNPLIEIEDVNEMAKKYWAERKAKKDAGKKM